MSTTLLIKHLCSEISVIERQDFLKHFGAQRVWFINSDSHSAFASFRSQEAAEEALLRLHQLELFGKRLVVEYAKDSNAPTIGTTESDSTHVKRSIDRLNSWNPSVNLLQPPSPTLRYKYPPSSPHILINIMYALRQNDSFYIQTLHLMNKIGLDPPFDALRDETRSFLNECLSVLDVKIPDVQHTIINSYEKTELSTEESEISSAEDVPHYAESQTNLPRKRKSNVKRINKKPKLTIQQIPNLNSDKRKNIDTKNVFEEISLQEAKKIEVKVSKILLPISESTEVIGTIGKMNPDNSTNDPVNILDNNSNTDVNTHQKTDIVTSKELVENRVSQNDMKSLAIFKNYHPGTPSLRLYIKNLAKEVTKEDMERIFKRYVVDCSISEVEMFNVRVMQEGRMKGQAFISLPSEELSEKALSETNGFILKGKPMIVQFARTAK